jgi:hypothetical protein
MKKYRTKSGKVEEKLQGVNATVNPSEKAQIAMAGGADTLKDVQTILGQEGKRNNLKGQGAKHLVSFYDPDDDETGAANTFGGVEVGSNFGVEGATEGVFAAGADPSAVEALGYSTSAIEGYDDYKTDPRGTEEGARAAAKSALLDVSKKAKHDRVMNIASKAVGLNLERARAAATPTPPIEEIIPEEYAPKKGPFDNRNKARNDAKRAILGKNIPEITKPFMTAREKVDAMAVLGVASAVIPPTPLTPIALAYTGIEYASALQNLDRRTVISNLDVKSGKTTYTTYATRQLAAAKNKVDTPTTPDYSGDGDDAPKKKKKKPISYADNKVTLDVIGPTRAQKRYRGGWRTV